jgi:hypothetical protein
VEELHVVMLVILNHAVIALVLWIVLLDNGVILTPALQHVVVALRPELVSSQPPKHLEVPHVL